MNRNGQPESIVPNGDVSGETPAVSIRDLSKRYGSGSSAITALEDVSIEIPQRSVVGLLGPNGAGKTTALKSALGLVLPTEGAVSVLGVDVVAAPDEAYRHVGAMLEGARNVYWRLTPRENLRFFASLQGLTQTDERAAYHDRLLETLGLADRADDSLNDFSRGMKQKVGLAATLARETPVVFLDEPTLGLDVEATRALRRRIRSLAEEEGRTVVLSSHDMDVVQSVCDRVIIMNDGRVVADDPVEKLIDVFRSRDYRISVEGDPSTVRRRLADTWVSPTELSGGGETTSFACAIPDGSFYELSDTLQAADLEVVTISAMEPDLEQAFLQLTDGDHGGQRRPVASGADT